MSPEEDKALANFTEYFVKNYSGPNTIIHDPRWHAPKLFRAALHAIKANGLPAQIREQRTLQPAVSDAKLTIEVALQEADRCRRYPDPVLNEMVIVVLADEVLKLR